jgi:putative phage-type endonuclease
VSTNPERVAWLIERQQGLGATDIASLAGVGFRTPQEVYESKFGEVNGDDAHPLLLMGLELENLNAQLYHKATGLSVNPRIGIDRHPELTWACSTLDRINENEWPVELKYTPFFSHEWGEQYTECVPLGYIVQVQWQMFIQGADTADLSALSGTGEHRVYRVPRDEAIIASLTAIGGEFWNQFILRREAPPASWRAEAVDDVRLQAERIALGKSLVLADEAAVLIDEREKLLAIGKEAEQRADEIKLQVLAMMGDASSAVAGGYRITRKQIEGGKEISYLSKPYVRTTFTKVKK